MKSIKAFFIGLITAMCISVSVRAQVIVLQKNALDKIKNGHSHVIVTSLNFPRAHEFLAVFKKYWTVTKGVDLQTAQATDGNLVSGDSYFILEEHTVKNNSGASAVYVYLNFGIPSERAVKKKKGWKEAVAISLAHIELSADLNTMVVGYLRGKELGFDFDGGGHLYHWGPGFLKNYLIQLNAMIQTSKEKDFAEAVTDKKQLQNLKTQTLYCPGDNLYRMGIFVKGDKASDIKELFEDYKYPYREVTDDELDKILLDDSKEIYYLLFVRNATGKLVAVVNSKTGAIIYSRYNEGTFSISSNLKSGDLKYLYKAINKN
ncbi:MAG: hypothetical protein JST19_14260 [Bacteroidetes bacterium]|nr:hypothetical protein [Bacteroidota bacterium]